MFYSRGIRTIFLCDIQRCLPEVCHVLSRKRIRQCLRRLRSHLSNLKSRVYIRFCFSYNSLNTCFSILARLICLLNGANQIIIFVLKSLQLRLSGLIRCFINPYLYLCGIWSCRCSNPRDRARRIVRGIHGHIGARGSISFDSGVNRIPLSLQSSRQVRRHRNRDDARHFERFNVCDCRFNRRQFCLSISHACAILYINGIAVFWHVIQQLKRCGQLSSRLNSGLLNPQVKVFARNRQQSINSFLQLRRNRFAARRRSDSGTRLRDRSVAPHRASFACGFIDLLLCSQLLCQQIGHLLQCLSVGYNRFGVGVHGVSRHQFLGLILQGLRNIDAFKTIVFTQCQDSLCHVLLGHAHQLGVFRNATHSPVARFCLCASLNRALSECAQIKVALIIIPAFSPFQCRIARHLRRSAISRIAKDVFQSCLILVRIPAA